MRKKNYKNLFFMPEISILLIGDLDRPEFQGVGEFLASFGQVRYFLEAETAAGILATGEIVADLTVIVQSFPGEFSQQTIDRLRAASPVSRMIALLGSWCEGEMRSGQPWPTVIRVYWHQGLGRIGREIGRLARGDCPNWGLPITATDEDRMLAAIPPRRTGFQPVGIDRKSVLQGGLIGIAAARYQSFEWLSAACRLHGYATIWFRGPHFPLVEGLKAILADGTDFQRTEIETLREIAVRYPQTKWIALMDFPRIEDRRRLLDSGAATVLSKPFSVEDLAAELEQL
jgi:CheY-like chemotaxis protein